MSYTVAEINQYARSICGYEKNSDDDQGFITDSFILSSLNKALQYMSDEKCFSATGYIQLIPGQKEYILPDTFIEMVENDPIFIYHETTEKQYKVGYISNMVMSKFNSSAPAQGSVTNGNVLMSRRENKIVLENYTPTLTDTSYFFKIHFYKEHEQLTLSTETPYRVNGPSQRIMEDFIIADIYKRDKEYTLSERHENKFYALVAKYKTKQLNNTVRQSHVHMASDFNTYSERVETYV